MPLALRIALEAVIIASIVLTMILCYLVARRRAKERERLGLAPPSEQLAHFDELLSWQERVRGSKKP